MFLLFIDIVIVLVFCFLGIRILVRNRRNPVNIVFSTITLFSVIFLINVDVMLLSGDPAAILFCDRMSVFLGSLLTCSIFILSALFPVRILKLKTVLIVLLTLPLVAVGIYALLTPFTIIEASVIGGTLIEKTGGGFYIWFGMMLVYTVASLILFVRSYRTTRYARYRSRLLLIFWGIILSTVIILFLSVLLPELGNSDFYHAGVSIAAVIFILSISYAVVSEKLIDINNLILDILKWVLTIAMLAGFVTLSVVVIEPMLDKTEVYKKIGLYCIDALVFYFFMQLFMPTIEGWFKRNRNSLQKVFDQFIEELLKVQKTNELILKTVSTVKTALGLSKMEFFLFKNHALTSLDSPGKDTKIPAGVVNYFVGHSGVLELEEFLIEHDSMGGDTQIKTFLEKHGAEIAVPLVYGDSLIGVIVIGEKRDKSSLNMHEFRFLQELRKYLTIALNNAILVDNLGEIVQDKTEEMQGQKLALEYALNTNERDMYIFRSINEISRLLLSINYYSAKDLYHTIADIFPGFINIENVAVYGYSKKDGVFSLLVANNIDLNVKEYPKTAAYSPRCILGMVVETGKSVFIGDIHENKGCDPEELAKFGVVKSVMAIPIKVRGEISAIVLFVDKIDNDTFDKYDFYFVNTVSHLLNVSLERVVIFEDKLKSERFTAIGQMAANIIHDIKNPMAGIIGFAECLSSPEFSEEDKAEFVKMIISESERLVALASEILEYTRGEIKIKKSEVKIPEFMDEVDSLLRMMFKERGIRFFMNVGYDGTISFDGDRMKRVFYNIAHNAMDAMKNDGEFTLNVSLKGDRAVFSLKDNGKGIPKEIRDSLFEPFVTYGKHGGTGLGLAITREIVHLHKGEITFETAANTGTTFYIELPLE
ncbi:MAG: hypothetical protein A2Y33_09520 [Spirochaetes bacterium GWF1_51_8]|nr:MAG: hypothetical protein A2Y33_09520 [Spirochaetes bacterium GWF1_51_8]